MSRKVSIIAISYNHGPFIEEALNSVFNQTHDDIDLIILDDGSTDNSRDEIKRVLGEREAKLFLHNENIGYTKIFNKGLAEANGEFVVDFALDDVMRPDFLKESLKAHQQNGEGYGVSFSNAEYINPQSKVIEVHADWLKKQGIIESIPSGDIFQMVLKKYFICSPSMVINKKVFDRIGGYDDNLAYEDFDFWVRSSKCWKYTYIDKVLIQKRNSIQVCPPNATIINLMVR